MVSAPCPESSGAHLLIGLLLGIIKRAGDELLQVRPDPKTYPDPKPNSNFPPCFCFKAEDLFQFKKIFAKICARAFDPDSILLEAEVPLKAAGP